jgi:hypothetical protein
MSRHTSRCKPYLVVCFLAPMILQAGSGLAREDDPPAKVAEEKRVAVAKCTSPEGTILTNEGPGKPWTFVDRLGPIYTHDRVVTIPSERGVIVPKSNGVRLTLVGNLPVFTKVPVFESAVVLHDSEGFDLDFTLEEGRVLITNRKDKGPAKVHINVGEEGWTLTLADPGDEILIEAWSRWMQGMPFQKDPKFADEPTTAALALVLSGNVSLKSGAHEFALSAPPGLAVFEVESKQARPSTPRRVDAIPAALDPASRNKPEWKRARERADRLLDDAKKNDIPTALVNVLKAASEASDKAQAQETIDQAVFTMGALDQLGLLVDTLGGNVGAEREAAVSALRHWIGRDGKQDMALYNFLIKEKKYSEGAAEILVGLLHSFGETDLSRAETFDTLIRYLRNDKLPIRELAYWHLTRVVPDNKIAYDPAGTKESWEKAFTEWKKLVPNGKVPGK